MGRYILKNRGTIRDLRSVRPEVVRPTPAPVAAPDPEPEAPAPSLFSMPKVDLIELAIKRGIDATGTRAEILGRLARDG